MNDFNTLLALLGGLTLVLGLGSRKLAASPLPPSLLALIAGVALGPAALHLIDLEALGERSSLLERLSRLALAIGLMGVALRVPRSFPRRNRGSMLVLIAGGMALMWAITTSLAYVVLGLPFWLCALIAAILTPTDPIAATPVVTGEVAENNIPERLRNAISFESGANDGLAYLFVFLPFLFLTKPPEEALFHWLTTTLLWEVGVATLFGAALGYSAGKLLRVAEHREAIESHWRLVYTAALALLAAGAGRLIHSDEVLTIFAAGAMFTQVVSSEDRHNEEAGQEAVNRFFAIPIFVILGAAIPWEGWADLGWSGVLLAVLILLLRRPPTILLMRPLLPQIRNTGDALFVGWFGPIAVAAMYYAGLMEHRLGEPVIWDVVSLVVCASVLAHGVTGAPLTRLYGRRAGLRGAAAAERETDEARDS